MKAHSSTPLLTPVGHWAATAEYVHTTTYYISTACLNEFAPCLLLSQYMY
jgi:hypothetical protein